MGFKKKTAKIILSANMILISGLTFASQEKETNLDQENSSPHQNDFIDSSESSLESYEEEKVGEFVNETSSPLHSIFSSDPTPKNNDMDNNDSEKEKLNFQSVLEELQERFNVPQNTSSLDNNISHRSQSFEASEKNVSSHSSREENILPEDNDNSILSPLHSGSLSSFSSESKTSESSDDYSYSNENAAENKEETNRFEDQNREVSLANRRANPYQINILRSNGEENDPSLKKEKKKKVKFSQLVKEIFETRRQRKKYYAKIKYDRRVFHERNKEHFGQRFVLSDEITSIASELLEKHYSGIDSMKIGVKCLKELSIHKNNISELENIRGRCRASLADFKRQEKKGKIECVDKLKTEEKITVLAYMNQEFPNNLNTLEFLSRSIEPKLKCSIRGVNFSGGWVLAGGTGAFAFRCESPLGRREIYTLLDISIGLGFGGVAAVNSQEYRQKENGEFEEKFYNLTYEEIRNNKLNFTGDISCGCGPGIHINNNTAAFFDTMGVGLGAFGGLGIGTLFKSKKLRSNFSPLFKHLNLGFHD